MPRNPHSAPPTSSPRIHRLDKVALDLRQDIRIRHATRRLHGEHVVAPPRPSRPPESPKPDIAVLLQIGEPVLERRDALLVVAGRILANDALLLVVLEPLRGALQALPENGAAHAVGVRARGVRVEVLVHLVDELVLRVLEVDERSRVARRDPRPGAGPRIAFGRDVLLGSARGADAVDGGLVEVEDELLVHVVELVVCVEHHQRVVLVLACDLLPPALEAAYVGDDFAVPPPVVVRLHHGVRPLFRDVIDRLREVAQVGFVEAAGERAGRQALHHCATWSTSLVMQRARGVLRLPAQSSQRETSHSASKGKAGYVQKLMRNMFMP